MTTTGPERTGATQGEQIARAIGRAKREVERMIDLNPEVMLLVESDGTIARCNRALLAMFGLDEFGPVLGKRVADLFDEPGLADEAIYAPIAGNRSVHETEIDLPDGQPHCLRFTVVGSGDDVSLTVVLVSDITGQKELAAQLEKTYKTEAVRAAVGAIMHNVNQHLTVITVRARLMQLALERGDRAGEEFLKNLRDIQEMSLQIGTMLAQAGNSRDYVTEPYVDGMDIDILDLDKSMGPVPEDSSARD